MAQVDSNIYLQQQTPDIMGPMVQAMKLSSMAKENKLQQQQLDDTQAQREALKNNMVDNPDGTTTLNKQGALSDLMKTAPLKGLQMQQEFIQQDAAQYAAHQKMRMDDLDLMSRALGGVKDQASYNQAIKWYKDNGGRQDTSQIPAAYDGNVVNNLKMHALTGKEQLANNIQQGDLLVKQMDAQSNALKAKAAASEAGIPYSGAGSAGAAGGSEGQGGTGGSGAPAFVAPPKMQQKAMAEYTSLVNGSRQQADAAQSLKDIQAAQKLNEIASIAPGGDLNKLNPQQTKLAIMETVKMAGGSVPTESEMESMTPDNLAQKYAGSVQHLTNKSQPANAGEFLQQAIDYAHGIQTVGAQKLADRANEIADRQRPFLGEKGYQTVKGQITDEYKKNMPPEGRTRQWGGKTYKVIGNHWVEQ